MKICVDLSVCQSHGQCALAAPDIFELDDELNLQYDPHPLDDRLADAEEAALMCPTHAITIDAKG
jgi:ferredoxin